MKKDRSGPRQYRADFCSSSCMSIEILLVFLSLWYWFILCSEFDGSPYDMETLSCNDTPLGCCPVYSRCGNTSQSFQKNCRIQYIDLEAYHDYSNCPSLFQIIREESEIEPEPYLYRSWSIYRFNEHWYHYCTIDAACDYWRREEMNDFDSYKRNSLRGLYMFSTSLPTSEGCDQDWMILTILTNFNRRVYLSQIKGYLYLPLVFFLLFIVTLLSTCPNKSKLNYDITDCFECKSQSYSGVSESDPKLRGSC